MPQSLADIRARKKPKVQDVDIPLDGSLLHQLNEALAAAADGDEAAQADVERLQAEVGGNFATFTFRQLAREAYRALRDQHTDDDGRVDEHAFGIDLIAACCVDPEMTAADVAAMFAAPDEGWGEAEWRLLYGTALMVNEAPSRVPFGGIASPATRS